MDRRLLADFILSLSTRSDHAQATKLKPGKTFQPCPAEPELVRLDEFLLNRIDDEAGDRIAAAGA